MSTTVFVVGSIRETLLSPWFGIHTSPSGPTTPSTGNVPTGTSAVTRFVAGSMRTTVSVGPDAAQTAVSVASSQVGESRPTGTAVTRFVAGSIRTTLFDGPDAAQTAVFVASIQVGESRPTGTVVTRFDAGSMR